MRLGFFLREALRALKRNAVPSFAAMATVLVTVLVLGVFIPVVQATTGAANEVRGARDRRRLPRRPTRRRPTSRASRNLLENDTPHVARVEFISKDAGATRSERKRRTPRPTTLLGANPLPDTFRVTPTTRTTSPRSATRSRRVGPGGDAHRRSTRRSTRSATARRTRNKILSVTRVVKLTMALLAGLLVLASVLLIANTIRLSLYARRREVEVMKLVGATDWFIRWPFVIEGVLVGALGGVLAILAARRRQGRAGRPAGGRLRADRRAGHDELPAADRAPARRRGRRCRRSAPACRCGASCASEPAYRDLTQPRVPWLGRMRPRRRSITAAVLVDPAARRSWSRGIWLGGHPDMACPSRCATRWSATTTARVYDEAIDTLERRLLPQGRPQAAARQVARAAGRARSTTASRTTSPRATTSDFQAGHRGRVRGRRHDRRGGRAAGCAC